MIELYTVMDATGEVRGASLVEGGELFDAFHRDKGYRAESWTEVGIWFRERQDEGWRCLPGYTVVERRVVEEHARLRALLERVCQGRGGYPAGPWTLPVGLAYDIWNELRQMEARAALSPAPNPST